MTKSVKFSSKTDPIDFAIDKNDSWFNSVYMTLLSTFWFGPLSFWRLTLAPIIMMFSGFLLFFIGVGIWIYGKVAFFIQGLCGNVVLRGSVDAE